MAGNLIQGRVLVTWGDFNLSSYRGPGDKSLQDERGLSALQMAEQGGHAAIVALLQ